jgi:hypothetical protein
MNVNPLADVFDALDLHPDHRRALHRIAKRFSHVDENGCWYLTGKHNRQGRPTMRFNGETAFCSRVIVGILDDVEVWSEYDWHTRHLCGCAACVRPDHLTHGTATENAADRDFHGKTARGERSGTSKLTEDEARAILVDPRTHAAIAAEYGVARSTVSCIKSGYSWPHLQLG